MTFTVTIFKIGYIIAVWLVLGALRIWICHPATQAVPQRRFSLALVFRYCHFIVIIGFALIVIHWPIQNQLQDGAGYFQALLRDDALNLSLMVGYFLGFLWHSFQIDRHQRGIVSDFLAYLCQHGYSALFILNILIFLRMDYFYLPLIPTDLPTITSFLIETGLLVVFIGMQLLVLLLRSLKMVEAPPKLKALVVDVAGLFPVKIRRVRIWKLERVANAFATGLILHSIFITETLADRMDDLDLRMVIGHECAHFKKHHLEIRIVLIGTLMFIGATLLEYYPDWDWWIYLLIAVALCLFFKIVARAQEFQADHEAAKRLGGSAQMASALSRVYEVNATPSRFGRILRWLVGHPDLEVRIKKLQSNKSKSL